jgi:hypothetical protein
MLHSASAKGLTRGTPREKEGLFMKRLARYGLLLGLACVGMTSGCARPGEFGYTPAYTTKERFDMIARNWDYEGKQLMDDMDSLLLLRPASHLTMWNVR